jgi:drug/metabolite transporter (DMT)-like permease
VTIVFILVSVTLSALAQITMKSGMSSAAIRGGLDDGSLFSLALDVISNPFVMGGLGLYGISAVLWLGVLARFEVSRAYPFVGLGFVFTMVFAALFLGEKVTAARLVGTLLVIGGTALVARS